MFKFDKNCSCGFGSGIFTTPFRMPTFLSFLFDVALAWLLGVCFGATFVIGFMIIVLMIFNFSLLTEFLEFKNLAGTVILNCQLVCALFFFLSFKKLLTTHGFFCGLGVCFGGACVYWKMFRIDWCYCAFILGSSAFITICVMLYFSEVLLVFIQKRQKHKQKEEYLKKHL